MKDIDIDSEEVRKIARELTDDCNAMSEKTERMAVEILRFESTYHDPDSAGIIDDCADILTEIKKLSPQVKEVSVLLNAYAEALEG